MANLIQNPNFGNWRHVQYLNTQDQKTITIEAPENWDFVYVPKESDPAKVPQSLHRDNGFVISAGYLKWEAGYKQGNVQLEAGTRYQLKARIKADVNFPGGQAPDLTAITWRFTVESDKGKIEQDWSMTSQQQTKQTEDFYLIFDAEEDMSAAITFWARSFYAGNDCDFWIYEVTLEPVEKTNAVVPKIGNPVAAKSVDATEKLASADVQKIVNQGTQKSLGDVTLTMDEVDMIAGALRSLAVGTDGTTTAGLNKLAEVFERLK